MKKISILLVLVLAMFVSCEKNEVDSEKLHFVYISPAAAVSYWVDVASGITAAANELGVKIDLVGPDQVDQMRQIEAIKTSAVDQPDGIITMALNPVAFSDPVDYVVENGVPVVLLDGDAPESQRAFYVGVDTYKQGLEVGELIAKELNGSAKIGIVTAGLDIEIINSRIDGLRKICENYPNMEIVAIEDAGGDVIMAGDKATAMLQTYPEINVMIAAGASDVPGVGKAIDNLGLDKTVMGIAFNDDPQGVDYLKTGIYDYILCSLPSEEGYAAVQAMYHVVNGTLPEGSPDTVYLRSVVITADNADSYKDVTPPTFEELLEAAK